MQKPFSSSFSFANATQQMKRISDAAGKMITDNTNNNLQFFNELQNVMGLTGVNPFQVKSSSCNACPPDCDCPPQCLASIIRDANIGEVIVIPFRVRNSLQTAKTYKVGVRPIYDDNGNLLPEQPSLNKTSLTLQPGQAVLVEMTMDLTKGYTAGNSYSTEIVIREQDINQNVCFTLNVNAATLITEVSPLSENSYYSHFQSWQSHYYCDKKPTTITTQNPGTPGAPNQNK
jgi:hypothetical protein